MSKLTKKRSILRETAVCLLLQFKKEPIAREELQVRLRNIVKLCVWVGGGLPLPRLHDWVLGSI